MFESGKPTACLLKTLTNTLLHHINGIIHTVNCTGVVHLLRRLKFYMFFL